MERSEGSKERADGRRRKSTLISFLCEKDPLAPLSNPSFVGWDPDECAYTFIVRSNAACGGAQPVEAGVGPGGVFGIIVVIAVLVYFIGGIMYQRSVEHARGWRQLPNYSMWSSIWSFFQVSLGDLYYSVSRARRPRVVSMREGLLPKMEYRPVRPSRSSQMYYPP